MFSHARGYIFRKLNRKSQAAKAASLSSSCHARGARRNIFDVLKSCANMIMRNMCYSQKYVWMNNMNKIFKLK